MVNNDQKKMTKNDLKRFQEWQEHQFSNEQFIRNSLHHSSRPHFLGWLLFILTSIEGIAVILILKEIIPSNDIQVVLAICLIAFSIIGLNLVVSIRLIKSNNRKFINFRSKKTIGYIILFLITTCILFVGYSINVKVNEIVITNIEQYEVKQVQDKNLIFLKTINITLECSDDDYLILWHEKTEAVIEKRLDMMSKYILVYKWNKLFPQKGRIIEIIELDDSQ